MQPRRCWRINRELAGSTNVAALAREYACSEPALRRHKADDEREWAKEVRFANQHLAELEGELQTGVNVTVNNVAIQQNIVRITRAEHQSRGKHNVRVHNGSLPIDRSGAFPRILRLLERGEAVVIDQLALDDFPAFDDHDSGEVARLPQIEADDVRDRLAR